MSLFTDYLEKFAEISIIIFAIVMFMFGVLFFVGVTDTIGKENESYIKKWVRSYQLHFIGLIFLGISYIAFISRKNPLLKALFVYFR